MEDPPAGRYQIALRAVSEAFWASARRSPLVRPLVRVARRARRLGRRRSGTRLCVDGWYYLLVLAFVLTAAMAREMNLMLVLVGMLLGPLLFSWRLVVATMGGLKVRRKMPSGICAGDLLVVNVQLTNTRQRLGSWAVAIQEQILAEAGPGRGTGGRPKVFFLYVPAGRSRDGVYRGRLPQRGRYRFGPMRVSTRFPFGLFERRITFDQTDTLTVFPRLGRLTHAWVTRHREAFEGSQRREQRSSRIPGEFYGVREWRSGDSRRWIHWRSSARHGTLVVRQFEQQRNREVAVLVDLWQPESPNSEDLENVELAVSFAATVVADLCRKGSSHVLMGTTGARPECTGGPASLALLQGAMQRLAVAEASSEDRLPALIEHALARIEPGAEVVLISARANDLNDAARFPMLWSDPARRAMVRRIRTVHTATEELAEYFQAE
jgi:uncharacterized protein (DUF58 family)